MKTKAGLVIAGVDADAAPTIMVLTEQGPDLEGVLQLSQGIFAGMQRPRPGSLAERLTQLFAEESLDWYALPREERQLLADCLRRLVALERAAHS